jgi:hypothetical protein
MTVLDERWVLALATRADDGLSYPAPLFYAVAGPPGPGLGPRLVFASRPDSAHGRHLGDGPTLAAAAVYLESEVIGELRGVQLRGEVVRLDRLPGPAQEPLRAAYLRRHPVAAARLGPEAPERLYGLAVTWAKLTDNRLGFGVKLAWEFRAGWNCGGGG